MTYRFSPGENAIWGLLREKKYLEAEKAIENQKKSQPPCNSIDFLLAVLCFETGNFEKGLETLVKCDRKSVSFGTLARDMELHPEIAREVLAETGFIKQELFEKVFYHKIQNAQNGNGTTPSHFPQHNPSENISGYELTVNTGHTYASEPEFTYNGYSHGHNNLSAISPGREDTLHLFNRLFAEMNERVENRVRRELNDDDVISELLQDIWSDVYVALHKRPIHHYYAYIWKIVDNKIADRIRRIIKHRKRWSNLGNRELTEMATTTLTENSQKELWEVYNSCLKKLPPELELAWRLKMDTLDIPRIAQLAKMTPAELHLLGIVKEGHFIFRGEQAAKIMSLSIDQYGRRYEKARKMLRDMMGKYLRDILP